MNCWKCPYFACSEDDEHSPEDNEYCLFYDCFLNEIAGLDRKKGCEEKEVESACRFR